MEIKKCRDELTSWYWGPGFLESPFFRPFSSHFRWKVHIPASGKEKKDRTGYMGTFFTFNDIT